MTLPSIPSYYERFQYDRCLGCGFIKKTKSKTCWSCRYPDVLLEQPEDEQIRLIPLTGGHCAIVDACDYEWLMQWRWGAVIKDSRYQPYAGRMEKRNGQNRSISMHRFIMGMDSSNPLQVDHINRDHLDNRRSNLRAVTQFENLQNVGIRRNNKSGVPGVYFVKAEDIWIAKYEKYGERHYIGRFKDKRAAIAARKAAQ